MAEQTQTEEQNRIKNRKTTAERMEWKARTEQWNRTERSRNGAANGMEW